MTKPSKAFWEAILLVGILFVTLVGSAIYLNGWCRRNDSDGDDDDGDAGSLRKRDRKSKKDKEADDKDEKRDEKGDEKGRQQKTEEDDSKRASPSALRDRRKPRREEEDVYEDDDPPTPDTPRDRREQPSEAGTPPPTPNRHPPRHRLRTLRRDNPDGSQVQFVLPENTDVNISTPITSSPPPTPGHMSRRPRSPPPPGGGAGAFGGSGGASGGSGTSHPGGSSQHHGGGGRAPTRAPGGAHTYTRGVSDRSPTLIAQDGYQTYPPRVVSAGPFQTTFAMIPPVPSHFKDIQVHRAELPEGPDVAALYAQDLLAGKLSPTKARARTAGPELNHQPLPVDPPIPVVTTPTAIKQDEELSENVDKRASKKQSTTTGLDEPETQETKAKVEKKVKADKSVDNKDTLDKLKSKAKDSKASKRAAIIAASSAEESDSLKGKIRKTNKKVRADAEEESSGSEDVSEDEIKNKKKDKKEEGNKAKGKELRKLEERLAALEDGKGSKKEQKKTGKATISSEEESESEAVSEKDRKRKTTFKPERKLKTKKKAKPKSAVEDEEESEEESGENGVDNLKERPQRSRIRREQASQMAKAKPQKRSRLRVENNKEEAESELEAEEKPQRSRRAVQRREEERPAAHSVSRTRRPTVTAMEEVLQEEEEEVPISGRVQGKTQQLQNLGVQFKAQRQQLEEEEDWDQRGQQKPNRPRSQARRANDQPQSLVLDEEDEEEQINLLDLAKETRSSGRQERRHRDLKGKTPTPVSSKTDIQGREESSDAGQSSQPTVQRRDKKEGITVLNNIGRQKEQKDKSDEESNPQLDHEEFGQARKLRAAERKAKANQPATATARRTEEGAEKFAKVNDEDLTKSAAHVADALSSSISPPRQDVDAHGGDLPPAYTSHPRNGDTQLKRNFAVPGEVEGEETPPPTPPSSQRRPMEKYPIPPDYHQATEEAPLAGSSQSHVSSVRTRNCKQQDKSPEVSPVSPGRQEDLFEPSPTTPSTQILLKPQKEMKEEPTSILEPLPKQDEVGSLNTILRSNEQKKDERKMNPKGQRKKVNVSPVESGGEQSSRVKEKEFKLEPSFTTAVVEEQPPKFSNVDILEEELGFKSHKGKHDISSPILPKKAATLSPPSPSAAIVVHHMQQEDAEGLITFDVHQLKEDPPSPERKTQIQASKLKDRTKDLWNDRNNTKEEVNLRRNSSEPAEKMENTLKESKGDLSPGAGAPRGLKKQEGLWNSAVDLEKGLWSHRNTKKEKTLLRRESDGAAEILEERVKECKGDLSPGAGTKLREGEKSQIGLWNSASSLQTPEPLDKKKKKPQEAEEDLMSFEDPGSNQQASKHQKEPSKTISKEEDQGWDTDSTAIGEEEENEIQSRKSTDVNQKYAQIRDNIDAIKESSRNAEISTKLPTYPPKAGLTAKEARGLRNGTNDPTRCRPAVTVAHANWRDPKIKKATASQIRALEKSTDESRTALSNGKKEREWNISYLYPLALVGQTTWIIRRAKLWSLATLCAMAGGIEGTRLLAGILLVVSDAPVLQKRAGEVGSGDLTGLQEYARTMAGGKISRGAVFFLINVWICLVIPVIAYFVHATINYAHNSIKVTDDANDAEEGEKKDRLWVLKNPGMALGKLLGWIKHASTSGISRTLSVVFMGHTYGGLRHLGARIFNRRSLLRGSIFLVFSIAVVLALRQLLSLASLTISPSGKNILSGQDVRATAPTLKKSTLSTAKIFIIFNFVFSLLVPALLWGWYLLLNPSAPLSQAEKEAKEKRKREKRERRAKAPGDLEDGENSENVDGRERAWWVRFVCMSKLDRVAPWWVKYAIMIGLVVVVGVIGFLVITGSGKDASRSATSPA